LLKEKELCVEAIDKFLLLVQDRLQSPICFLKLLFVHLEQSFVHLIDLRCLGPASIKPLDVCLQPVDLLLSLHLVKVGFVLDLDLVQLLFLAKAWLCLVGDLIVNWLRTVVLLVYIVQSLSLFENNTEALHFEGLFHRMRVMTQGINGHAEHSRFFLVSIVDLLDHEELVLRLLLYGKQFRNFAFKTFDTLLSQSNFLLNWHFSLF